jgi:hypothetical protein
VGVSNGVHGATEALLESLEANLRIATRLEGEGSELFAELKDVVDEIRGAVAELRIEEPTTP